MLSLVRGGAHRLRRQLGRLPAGRLASLLRQDLALIYARDLRKWLIAAPLVGVSAGLMITLVAQLTLGWLWPPVLAFYLRHPGLIPPCLALAFAGAGLLMERLTPDPDEHSSEEVIRSYHERGGRIDTRPLLPKLAAAVLTVGCGGSAALEGPSIYGGAALGSRLWRALRPIGLAPRDRRILLVCGAAAGMSAVFRAPLTGIVFALEMPFRDDLAHEALVPSLIASVVSFATMSLFLGSAPLFGFAAAPAWRSRDLAWSALLGLLVGLAAMAFVVAFRRARRWAAARRRPHWLKMALGGLLTGLAGLLFLRFYPGRLVPIGPNYEAAAVILNGGLGTGELLAFTLFKLAATLFTLACGGVSAMFVPLFLCGGALGEAFARAVVHTPVGGLYAAVGMASFLSAGYKTPLAAVVFVAEATGGHAFLVPALIGAAVAYVVSGDASASGDQRLHEGERLLPPG